MLVSAVFLLQNTASRSSRTNSESELQSLWYSTPIWSLVFELGCNTSRVLLNELYEPTDVRTTDLSQHIHTVFTK